VDRELEREPGATWRKGLAHDIDDSIAIQFYPDNDKEAMTSSNNKKRAGNVVDPIREGERFRAPRDCPDPAWPRVFVGRAIPPTIEGAGFKVTGDSHAWIPLTRRLDLDYVFQRMLDDPRFENVRAWGSKGSYYKIFPWLQLRFARV
jgi:hypothetical protein